MVEIIAGEKGKGKTKHLLDRVNLRQFLVLMEISYIWTRARNTCTS